jgi:hypothetical protein
MFLAKVLATASDYLLVLATMGDATQRGTFLFFSGITVGVPVRIDNNKMKRKEFNSI